MNINEAMDMMRDILRVLDEIYHALVEKKEAKED